MSDPVVDTGARDELLASLTDEFLRRHRAGERPTAEEYATQHPDLAHQIRDLFPAMVAMERGGLGVTVDPATPGDHASAAIGRYKLLERIGEGGFGVVYLAEQQHPVRRKVALKVIKPGMDSRQVLARFEAERQALAIMDHPNIARVLDAGATEAGRPYFVMELVKGEPITTFCDNAQLSPRQRLELFVQVCQAVQHAHQKGVIHRDIKPSNVLVAVHDTTPVVKVIDFGVAKALGQELTEKTLFTGLAQLVGTPLYMSPEQAGHSSLDVDTRSDIYSLGVLLYELLTGTTPFDKERFKKAAQDEIRRIIREEEPPKPSTRLSESKDSLPSISAQRHTEPAKLTKLVRGELDWIVMKALEKDRTRRYETATGLARDIERHLQDEPVEACPPSTSYKLRKFVRRNKATLVTASVIGLALLLAVGSLGWAVRDRTARQARVAREVALILSEVDQLQREQKWPEALAVARRADAAVRGGEADAQTTGQVRSLVTDLKLIGQLEQIRMQQSMVIGRTFDNAGADRAYAGAFRDYGVDVDTLAVETSIERFKARPAISVPVAAALDHWSKLRANLKSDTAAWSRHVDIARAIDPDPVRNKVRAMWGKPVSETADELRRLAESIDVRAHRPATLIRVASALEGPKQSDAALRLLHSARDAYPGDFWTNYQLARVLTERADHEGAVRFYTAALAIRPDAIAVLNNLGLVLKHQHKWDEAIAAYRRSIEIDSEFLYGNVNLGAVLHAQGKLDEAVTAFRKAVEIDPQYVSGYFQLAIVLRQQKKFDEARAVYRAAGKVELPDAWSCDQYAWLLAISTDVSVRDPVRAVALAEKAVALEPKDAGYWNTLGVARYRAGDWHGAIAALKKYRELRTDEDDWSNSFFMAMAHWQLGDKDAARQWYETGVDWMYNKATRMESETGRFRHEAADLLGVNQKKPLDASTAALESELVAMRTEARILRERREIDEAAEILERAVTLAQGSLPPDHDLLLELRISRAQALGSLGKFEQAEAELLNVRATAPVTYRVGARDALIQLYKGWAKPEKAVLLMRQRLNSAQWANPRTGILVWRLTTYQLEYAKMLTVVKRFQDAEAILREAYELAEGDQRPAVAAQFVDLYTAWDRPANAAEWRRSAATMPSAGSPTSTTSAAAHASTQPTR